MFEKDKVNKEGLQNRPTWIKPAEYQLHTLSKNGGGPGAGVNFFKLSRG